MFEMKVDKRYKLKSIFDLAFKRLGDFNVYFFCVSDIEQSALVVVMFVL